MKFFIVVAMYLSTACGQLMAATLNFDAFPPGVAESPLRFPGVTISETSGGALFGYGTGVFNMPEGGGVCGLGDNFSCTGDVSLLFSNPVSNLSFKGFDASTSDKATISVYSDDALVAYALVSGTSSGEIEIDFSGLSRITRVEIADRSSSSSRGIAYGGFTFDVDPPGSPVTPEVPRNVLKFDSFDRGVNDATTLDLGTAVLSETSGGKIFVYRSADFDMPENGGLCAFDSNSSCMGDFTLEFKQPIFDLDFSGFFAKLTDSAIVSLFDGDILIHTGTYFGNSAGTIRFDFGDLGKLTRLFIQDASEPLSKGIAYGDFKYRPYVPPIAAVPVPATLSLFLAGLVLLSVLGRCTIRYGKIGLSVSHR